MVICRDMKVYRGTQDADVPPAKNEPGWLQACETADEALQMKKEERVREYWFDFKVEDEAEGNREESEVEEMEVDAEPNETPKRSRNKDKKQHRRIRTIASSSDEESEVGETKRKIKNSKKSKADTDDDEFSPTKLGSGSEESESSESPMESENASSVSEPESDDNSTKRKSKSAPVSNCFTITTIIEHCYDDKRFIATQKRKKMESVTPSQKDKAGVKNRLQQFAVSESPSSVRSSPAPVATPVATSSNDRESTIWTHMRLDWAKEGNRKDLLGRLETHPDYDPRTLYVDPNFKNNLTPAMRQWWDIKSKNFDTVLFFKVGKFYEFYHWDACIAATELGITYMKVN